jgi:hypothetical protein
MSKEAGLRAMREARYAARAAGAPQAPARPAAPVAPAAPKAVKTPTTASEPVTTPAAEGDELCGHRSINGRTCTREKGHSAKNHRYS